MLKQRQLYRWRVIGRLVHCEYELDSTLRRAKKGSELDLLSFGS